MGVIMTKKTKIEHKYVGSTGDWKERPKPKRLLNWDKLRKSWSITFFFTYKISRYMKEWQKCRYYAS